MERPHILCYEASNSDAETRRMYYILTSKFRNLHKFKYIFVCIEGRTAISKILQPFLSIALEEATPIVYAFIFALTCHCSACNVSLYLSLLALPSSPCLLAPSDFQVDVALFIINTCHY
ncbi:hypothetical protein ACOSQ2_022006 [Xanthoceras sorbifolium]